MRTNLEPGSRRPGMERSRDRTPFIKRSKGAGSIALLALLVCAIFGVGGAAAGDGSYATHVREARLHAQLVGAALCHRTPQQVLLAVTPTKPATATTPTQPATTTTPTQTDTTTTPTQTDTTTTTTPTQTDTTTTTTPTQTVTTPTDGTAPPIDNGNGATSSSTTHTPGSSGSGSSTVCHGRCSGLGQSQTSGVVPRSLPSSAPPAPSTGTSGTSGLGSVATQLKKIKSSAFTSTSALRNLAKASGHGS